MASSNRSVSSASAPPFAPGRAFFIAVESATTPSPGRANSI